MLLLHNADGRAALHAAAAAVAFFLNPIPPPSSGRRRAAFAWRTASNRFAACCSSSPRPVSPTLDAVSAARDDEKPAICTADELHYVPVPGTEWRLALWRYLPSAEATPRNHPLMLLSGVGTNAIGYDLSPGASFARYMSRQGFDTWIVEVRGAGLSIRTNESHANYRSVNEATVFQLESDRKGNSNGGLLVEKQSVVSTDSESDSETSIVSVENWEEGKWNEPQLVAKLTDTFLRLGERLSGYLNEGQQRIISAKFFDQISKLLEDAQLSERFSEIRVHISGLLEARETSAVATQIRDLSQRLVHIIEEGQKSVSPQLFDLQERLSATIEDFQKQLDLIVTYNWDFDNYLEEDIPAAMEYIKLQSNPKDGRLHAIGHSMGGILLYAMISKSGFKGVKSPLATVVTLASSVDYTSSKSSLKLLLPLADPAQALNVPVVPLGALLAAAYPLATRPPYALSWLNPQISAQDMMHPELFEKLVLNNFCTIPAKLILQLTTAFREGGLCDRSGTFSYKDHLHKCDIPVLAFAADQDLICPPEAVYETVKLIPEHMVTYKLLGKPDGPHYAHYDLVGGRLAVDEVYPCIIEFLSQHDYLCSLKQSARGDQTTH